MERIALYRPGTPMTFTAWAAILAIAFTTVRAIFGHRDTWLSLAAFGLCLAIALVVDVRRRRLAPVPVAVLDSAGLTLPLDYGRDARTVQLPWSNVAGAFVAAKRSKGRLFFLQIAVRDLERFLESIPPEFRAGARRAAESRGAPIRMVRAGSGLDDQIALIERYRDAADSAPVAVEA